MSNDFLLNMGRFFILVIAQVLIFNNINLFGYINAYIYILFIILYPYKKENRMSFLFFSFLIGLTIDMFSDSGGVHAAASLVIAYLRPAVMRFSFGYAHDLQTLKLANTMLGQRLLYLTVLILTHHFILFSLEIFSFTNVLSILNKTATCGLLTLFTCTLFISLFSRKRS